MDFCLYLLIGLLLSLVLACYPKIVSMGMLLAYWLILLIGATGIISPFDYTPLHWSNFFAIEFSWQIDGLARLFTLLVSGIGILIFIYAGIYTQNALAKRAKLVSLLQVFAISMLTIVLTDNTIVLFLAWELTTVTSYLLIQFDVTDKKANQSAFNGMFISVMGGLAMFAGFIILHGMHHDMTHGWSIQSTLAISSNPTLLTTVFYLLLLGGITKSAQFPFYFWLPGAMKAPTPVSAYLHSATMVNAGIYLFARFHPLFSPLAVWYPMLSFFGLSTMVISSILSIFQRDLKAILAYTTLFALGSMVYLLASSQWLAMEAFAILLLFHGLYKAAAFMWVGVLDKTYHTRDIMQLRGLGKSWPSATIIAIISLGAMAGLPPFFGFVVKEMLLEAKLASGSISYTMMSLGLISSMLIAAASLKCLYYWCFGHADKAMLQKKTPLPFGLSCTMVLAVMIVGLSFIEPQVRMLLGHSADSIISRPNLYMAHDGFVSPNSWVSTLLSLMTVVGGLLLLLMSEWLHCHMRKWPKQLAWLNPRHCFEQGLAKMLYFGRWFTYITQRQPVTKQLTIILLFLIVWLGAGFYTSTATWPDLLHLQWHNRSFTISLLSLLLVISGASLLISQQFLINMISLAVFGLIMSALFVLQGAPDVAMTQLLVEILTVIILVVALRKATFGQIQPLTQQQKIGHAVIAILLGLIITLLLLMVSNVPFDDHISQYYIQQSLPAAHGRNVVNVILVDFRALDTFGEALVILATALAIWLFIDITIKRKQRG